jgi:hypothetical protein
MLTVYVGGNFVLGYFWGFYLELGAVGITLCPSIGSNIIALLSIYFIMKLNWD